MSLSSDTATAVHQVFIGLLGRPPTKAGLAYWVEAIDADNDFGIGDMMSNIVNEQPEYAEVFGGESRESVVFSHFNYLFGRDPYFDENGENYWIHGEGEAMPADQLAMALIQGASAADQAVLDNKVMVSVYITHSMTGTNSSNRAILSDVGASSASVNAGLDAADGSQNNIFTLTEAWVPGGQLLQEEISPTYHTFWGYTPNGNVDSDVDGGVVDADEGDDEEGPGDDILVQGTDWIPGVPVEDLLTFLQGITGLDLFELGLVDDINDGVGPFDNVTNLTISDVEVGGAEGDNNDDNTSELTLSFADGTDITAEVHLGEFYMTFLNDLLFDAEGNSRLFQVMVDEGQSEIISSGFYNPIVLTPSENNGGTVEPGLPQTSYGDDLIVAGRTQLLHEAYIDGGGGYNTLEIDAKGVYAQPLALLNIQEVRIQNLGNVYTEDNSNDDTYPDLSDAGPNTASFIDLSRAIDLELLVVTEGHDYDQIGADGGGQLSDPGELTVVGLRNNAMVRLEGAFEEDINLHYGAGQTGGPVVQLNVGVSENLDLKVAHNSATLTLDSVGGGNWLYSADLGDFEEGGLRTLIITGDAPLKIGGYTHSEGLEQSFIAGTPSMIDASANTGGVDLYLDPDGGHHTITFYGSSGDDRINFHTEDTEYDQDESITIVGNGGNNRYQVDSYKVDITDLDGDNDYIVEYEGDTVDLQIIAGNGDHYAEIDVETAVLVFGDGDNDLNIRGGASSDDDGPGDSTDVDPVLFIQSGNGDNAIDADWGGLAIINLGTGGIRGNDVKIDAPIVDITTGAGDDSISITGLAASVSSGGGDDDITVIGQDPDYVTDATNSMLMLNGLSLEIDAGTGNNSVTLGRYEIAQELGGSAPSFQPDGSLIAMEGSYIMGENITLYVNTSSDLRAASLSGITRVMLDDEDDAFIGGEGTGRDIVSLTLLDSQVTALGASVFSVEGGTFGHHGCLEIVVTQDANLSDILDLASLSKAVELRLVVNDGVTLTLTAEELHRYVKADAIVLGETTDDDIGQGHVVITGASYAFDAYDETTGGGSVDLGVNVSVIRSTDGYSRPSDWPNSDTTAIDSDVTPEVGSVSVGVATDLTLTGEADLNFAGTITLVTGSTIDFSGLNGDLTGVWVVNFNDIALDGGVVGNSDTMTRFDIHLSGDAGLVDDGVNSTGVEWYVVCDIEDGPHTFWMSDSTQDVDVIGLHGNSGEAITFGNVPWGAVHPSVLLEGDGVANWDETLKAWGSPNYSTIGMVTVDYFADGAPAVVNINNGGTELGMSSTGGERWFMAEGITLDNAHSLDLNVTEGDAMVAFIADDGAGAGLEVVNITATEDVTIGAPLPATVDTVDASGTVGALVVEIEGGPMGPLSFVGSAGGTTLTFDDVSAASGSSIDGGAGGADVIADGTVSLAAATLANISTVTLTAGAALTLTMDQADVIGASNFYDSGAAASLMLTGLSDQVFSLANYPDDYSVSVTLANDPVVTLNAATDLTGLASLVIPAGTLLELTMAQFQQLTGDGTITGDGSVHITDVMQADVGAAGTNLDLDDVDLSGATSTVTLTLAESLDLSDADLNDGGPSVDVFNVGDDMTLTIGNTVHIDGVDIVGGTNSTLTLTDTASALLEANDARGWDVDFLYVVNTLVANRNVDLLFTGLTERVVKVIYNGTGGINGVDQTVIIEEGTSVPGTLVFNKINEDDVEIENFILNMEGGTEIGGDLHLSSGDKEDGAGNDLLVTHLQSLTINSTGTAANLFSGDTANIIDGDVTAEAGPGPSAVENNLLNVGISAEQDLMITGDIIFNSVTGDDALTINDDDEATAWLIVEGTADVVTGIDTDDADVVGLNVENNGTGTLTLEMDSGDIDGDDALSFTGTGPIVLDLDGDFDLSDDVLTAVTEISIEDGDDLTLTWAQVQALGASNITLDGDPLTDTGNVEILGYDGTAFDSTAMNAGICVTELVMAAGDITLDASVNLGNVEDIIVPEGGSLTMTAAQYQQWCNGKAGTITGVDAGGMPSEAFTVNITGLTQADVDNNGGEFDLSKIDADDVTLTLAEDIYLDDDDILDNTDGESAAVIMADGQILGLATSSQADALDVTGGVGSIVIFQFDMLDGLHGLQIDASGYSIEELRATAIFVGGTNVEFIIDELDGAIWLRIYTDPTSLGFVSAVDRHVHFDADVSVVGGLIFNDVDFTEEVVTLTFDMEGGVTITGDVNLSTIDEDGGADPLVASNFSTLTINSTGADMNVINGDINAVAIGLSGGVLTLENNLLNVVINADTDFQLGDGGPSSVEGTIVFNAIGDVDPATDEPATLTVNGTAEVNLNDLDASDTDIGVLNIVNNLVGGMLTIDGGSPAIEGGAGLHTVNISGAGSIDMGGDGEGISAGSLTTLDASGSTGDIAFGEVDDVDSDTFNFTSGTGVTTMTVIDDTLNTLNTGETGWSFDFSAAAPGSLLTLGDDGGGALTLTAGASLVIDTGTATADVCIAETQDFSALGMFAVLGAGTIIVKDGVTVTLSAAQANGLTIVGENGTASTGLVTIVDFDGEDGTGVLDYDFSGISADVAGTITLASSDETASLATDLGAFSVTLTPLVASAVDLSGETIRFSTEEQAARDIIVAGTGALEDDGTTNSSNVVWLFDAITAPIDTDGYDADLGRVLFSEGLVASEAGDVEGMFTSLPSAILRVDFADVTELDILIGSVSIFRTLELASFVSVVDLDFLNDNAPDAHVEMVTVEFGGEAVMGNAMAGDVIAAPDTDPTTPEFDGFVFNSRLALSDMHFLAAEGFLNDNDPVDEAGEHVQPNGDATMGAVNTVGDVGVGIGTNAGIDLLAVTVNTFDVVAAGGGYTDSTDSAAGSDFMMGTVVYDSEATDPPGYDTATFTVTGDNDTEVASLDTSDDSIDTLVVTNTGTGTLTITGASPALDVDFTEEVWLDATNGAGGMIMLGTAGDPTRPGISGDDLSLVNVDTGALNMIDLGLIDAIDSMDFLLDASGNLGMLTGRVEGVTLDAGGTWTVTGGAGVDTLTIGDGTTFSFGGTLFVTGTNLVIDGAVDVSPLIDDGLTVPVEGFFVAPEDIDVLAGAELTILASQVSFADIDGAGTVEVLDLRGNLAAELFGILTTVATGTPSTGTVGDTGVVNTYVDTADDGDITDLDALPDDVFFTGSLGVAHVTISGDGTFNPDAAALAGYDRDGDGGVTTLDEGASFTVESALGTLNLLGSHVADATREPLYVDGAGTTNVDISASGVVSMSGMISATVNANFTVSSIVTTMGSDLGTAVVNIADGVVVTIDAALLDGVTVLGDPAAGAAVIITGDATGADLSGIGVDITFDAAAIVSGTTLPALVADQDLALTAVQGDGATVTGDGNIAVTIDESVDTDTDLDIDAFDLSGMTSGTGTLTATVVVATTALLDTAADLGDFDLVVTTGELELEGAQVDGRVVTGTGSLLLNNVSAGQDLSLITVAGGVGVEVTGGVVDLSDIAGLTFIEVATGAAADLTIGAEQFTALDAGADAILAELTDLASLTVDATITISLVDFPVDLDVDPVTGDVTGSAAGFVTAQVDDDGTFTANFLTFATNLIAGAEMTHQGLGNLVVDATGAIGFAGLADIFEFLDDGDVSFTDTAAITVFDSADGDKVDLGAFGVNGAAAQDPAAAQAIVALDLFFVDGGAAGDADTTAASATYIDGHATWTEGTVGDTGYFVIADDDSSAIYAYENITDDDTITADELTLLGTVDDVLIITDILG